MRVWRAARRAVALGVIAAAGVPVPTAVAQSGFGPGNRVLLDAHNAYPERGRWADRIDRALATGTPIAIEQDLFWRQRAGSSQYDIVVAHDKDALASAPTLETYFLQKIRPSMERALAEQRRATWPVITLNLDFKTQEPALLDAVWVLLGKYRAWLTTAPRARTPAQVSPLTVGPLLVLAGSNPAQRARFHDAVAVGERLRLFGAIPPVDAPGNSDDERESNLFRMTPAQLIAPRSSNYARWVNFPWLVVEAGGPTHAGTWSTADSVRLRRIVDRAHAQALWIRFYTLDGFAAGDGDGLNASYNFGSDAAVRVRWNAVRAAGVDFVATDHYERFQNASTRRR